MEIPRQKKTVRVAVTRPSVKKAAIVTAQNRRTEASLQEIPSATSSQLKSGASLVACCGNKNRAAPTLTSAFALQLRGEGVWSVLSFQILAPKRNCVLVSAHVPVNPCK
jgi:hypothetical protein